MSEARKASIVTDKNNSRWTSYDVDKLCRLASEGVTSQAIGEKLGRSPKSVQQKVSKMRKQVSGIPRLKFGKKHEQVKKPMFYLNNVLYENIEEAKEYNGLWDGKCWFLHNDLEPADREILIAKFGPVRHGHHALTPQEAKLESGYRKISDPRVRLYQWSKFEDVPFPTTQDKANEWLDGVLSDWGDEEEVEPVTPKPTTSSIPGTGSAINITPGNVDVKPTVKPVTPKLERVGSRRTVTTGTSNTAVVPAYLSGKPAPKPKSKPTPKPKPTPTYPHHYTVRIPKVLVAAVILVAVGVGGWLIGRGF
jgi:hypothetical protein